MRLALNVEVPLRIIFEAPTIAGLANAIQPALTANDGIEEPPIEAVVRGGEMPVSFAQQRLWFLDQLDPGSAAYNIPAALRFRGRLDLPALSSSLSEIVRRHEVLRTTFSVKDDLPVQVISPTAPVTLPVADLCLLGEQQREEEARRLAAEEMLLPFDLRLGPLMRARLVKVGEDDYVALLTMHHIISDGWSMGVLTRELKALYTASVEGGEAELPDLPVQYADFAVWQRGWLRGEVLRRHLDYWKSHLGEGELELRLPTDRPRPEAQTFSGARHRFVVSAEVAAGLRELSRRENATLFMTLVAAFKVLLYRYSGQQDVVISTGIANRNRQEVENLIGFFVNTLALRTDLSGDPSFRELVGRVREVTLGAYAHQDLPFEAVVEAVRPERKASHTPLFRVMFMLQNVPHERLELPEVGWESFDCENTTSKFELTLFMEERGDWLGGVIEYNTDLYEEGTIKRMADTLCAVLGSVASDAEAALSSIRGVSRWEGERLAEELSEQMRRQEESEEERWEASFSVQRMFERAAERGPGAVAIESAGREVTYRELEEKGNRVGNYLMSRGAGEGSIVAIVSEDRVEVIAAVLGCLKSGCAFMPLDTATREGRLKALIEEVTPDWYIIGSKYADVLGRVHKEGSPAKVICVDGELDQATGERLPEGLRYESDYSSFSNVGRPDREPAGDDFSYIYFTSGSTGRPKPIAGRLKGIDHFIRWEVERLGLEPGVRVSQLLTLSFDGSLRDIFAALCSGGAVCIPDSPDTLLDADMLIDWLDRSRVNVVHCVPSLFRSVISRQPAPDRFKELSYILITGEMLHPSDVERWMAIYGERVQLINMYGTSETTMAKFIHFVRREDTQRRAIPIGKPMRGSQALLVDERGRPCPQGAVGEIYIKTGYRSHGYYNRPEQTAERFVTNPLGDDPRDVVYRTGDMGRVLEDGSYEHLGRRDQQVKIRGARVELGEVEAVLSRQERVREVAVIDREDAAGYKYLCAYVVMGEGGEVSELRRAAEEGLSEYMVPSAYVVMGELPRTISGKVDRRALPAPGEGGEGEGSYEGPRTVVEEVLVGIWEQLLPVKRIGVNDNFFEKGGHSLMATQVVSRVREVMEVEVALRKLFERPTVRGLAESVEEAMAGGAGMKAPRMEAVVRGGEMPVSFAQQRLWFFHQLDPDSHLYNCPDALRLAGPLNVGALQQTMTEIVRRHEVLRTRFDNVDRHAIQIIDEPQPIPLPLADLSALAEELRGAEVRRIATQEAFQPFDLRNGPTFRIKLVRAGEEDHVLLLTLHHIVSDAWSMGVLSREVASLYESYSAGEPSNLEELPVQYADFAVWQRQWLQGEVLEAQLNYWRHQLGGNLQQLQLPTDRPRPELQTYRGARLYFALTAELSEAVKTLCGATSSTLYMVLLAAFKALLHRYTGQDDISVGSPIANRNRAETENLIGFFVNTMVLRSDLSGNPTFRELTSRVREVTLGAYTYQDLPFDLLVEDLRPRRKANYTPLFDVLFEIRGDAGTSTLRLPGLTWSNLDPVRQPAYFDLTLSMNDSPGGISGYLEYSTDLFDADTIEEMKRRFESLLNAVAANPDLRLMDIPLGDEEIDVPGDELFVFDRLAENQDQFIFD
jgi:amino acid adenylation domain-containing protein